MVFGAPTPILIIFDADILLFRTYYDGKQMISRLGNPFMPPKWFLDSKCSGFPHCNEDRSFVFRTSERHYT
jgi:hypothetical protein